jgi:putative alpha-1,2-mannosidase
MKSNRIYVLALAIALSGCTEQKIEDLSQFVDPFIGTDYVGHTHPAAQLPFGMAQLGPDTGTDKWEHCSGYCDADSSIIGFSHTHLSGTGCPDMGDIMLMPVTGELNFDRGDENDTKTGYRSSFSHESEEAHPGYYKVMLDDYGIKAELTASSRVGFHKYTYPEPDKSAIVIDLFDPQLPVITEKTVRPGEQAYLFDPKRVEEKTVPQVLAAASRTDCEKRSKRSYSFTTKSPLNTTNVMRVLLPAEPESVEMNDAQGMRLNNAAWKWDEPSRTCLLGFENNPDGVNVMLKC